MRYLIERYARMLAAYGRELTPNTRILDFCCGAGGMVSAFLENGYNVRGFEPFATDERHPMVDTLGWDCPYTTETYLAPSPPDLHSQWQNLRLPYPDGAFDFVFSQEVMEHVPCHETALRELRRVLATGGIAIHTFPARWRLIEPHVGVPMGAKILHPVWYRLWFELRPRMSNFLSDEPMTRSELARLALWYGRLGLNYLAPSRLRRIALRHFRVSDFRPDLWEAPRPPRSAWWYTHTRNVVWVTAD